MFGQIPLPDDVFWMNSKIEVALGESEEVWFENPEFDPLAAAAALRERMALGGPKLGETIGEADRKRLRDALRAANKPENAFDDQLIWQAYLSISDLVDSLNGINPMNLPERALRSLAKRQGKRIRSEWASMVEIMDFSKAQPPRQHLELIAKVLDGVVPLGTTRRVALDWASGDISAPIAAHQRMKEKYPELSAALVAKRNERWVPRIEDMLRRNRSTFMCVGLGHLVGSDSIQVLAADKGLKVEHA